ncbi:ARM repeat-containing protein [Metschnikowia bicuspidata var. bicuspidata NRRL YB-4993]|uniref:ARM repeat-containing protein n=1 Tax=Metschnikowia bicuspidata var. bicuspidata NRRL YB-4993 TaxID=869754 RepID=A0A1A0HHB0_9ASCO|nr:ARM repeat-containing protein [Metschnikowia bicuspidata var. bicuspidata NRRL YB-4993]OBA23262.1 ARM repeat-containing protein [Metschnikowia bicuspidata var. bicuspidata NRRL YB-4993]
MVTNSPPTISLSGVGDTKVQTALLAVRSGSLFSTNSIWNDDALHNHSPDRSISSGGGTLDLFPDLSHAGLPSSKPSSNRSHTTSGLTFAPTVLKADAFRPNFSPFLHSSHDDPMSFIDTFDLNSNELPAQGTRNRSQTYSGVYPKISYSASPSVVAGPLLQASQSASQNMPSYPNQNMPSYPNRNMHHSLQPSQPSEPSGPGAHANAEPFLEDDFNFFDLLITTNFENPSLGPTNTLLLDNVPQFLDASKLYRLLSQPTGMTSGFHNRGVLSVQVALTSNSKMALIICPSIEVAMNLKANFNHLEIVPGAILYVAFAKVSDRPKASSSHPAPSSTNPYGDSNNFHMGMCKAATKDRGEPDVRNNAIKSPPDVEFSSIVDSILATCVHIAGPFPIDFKKVSSIISNAVKYPKSEYKTSFGSLPDSGAARQMDAPKIRELRKSLEANEKALQSSQSPEADNETSVMSQAELESLATEMLDELPELCYDHIGNTVVQKIFTVLESTEIRLQMVKRILPYLALLGTHKNGTWAIQKIINSSQGEPEQKILIAESIRPFAVKLFNDQFGNYVLQCCLKFESPYNDFIFETICTNFMEISSGRFGVRCIRTILETLNDSKCPAKNVVTHEQLVLVSSLIVEHANELVVSSNGSLLITWFLETFRGFSNQKPDIRAGILCEKFLPHLDKLCTHKLANVTIFKLLNSKSDPTTRQRIMDAIFAPYVECEHNEGKPPTKLLEHILRESNENNAGPMFLQKVLSYTSLFVLEDGNEDPKYHQFATSQVKRVLLEMHIANVQPYKKLMDEVGLSNGRLSRTSSSNRKSKRGHGNMRNGQTHSPYRNGVLVYSQMAQASNMGAPVGYGGIPNENQPGYPPYGALYGINSISNNDSGRGFDTLYFGVGTGAPYGPPETQFNQDAHVMRQLEQLSLQSAAMGYASNPGTPVAGRSSQDQSLFF